MTDLDRRPRTGCPCAEMQPSQAPFLTGLCNNSDDLLFAHGPVSSEFLSERGDRLRRSARADVDHPVIACVDGHPCTDILVCRAERHRLDEPAFSIATV